jgi:N-carbamoyl-L-amino-acid hydrolase
MDVDADRLLQDLRILANFGRKGMGINRPAFSGPDIEARKWLRKSMQDAGLDACIDGVGNVFGSSRNAFSTVLIGSHTDSVLNGGWLDGSLGVVYGLEIARCWLASHPRDGFGIDVISFEDEEGAYVPFLGSSVFSGLLDATVLRTINTRSGKTLEAVLDAWRLSGVPAVRFEPKRCRAYLEAHIEQGPVLETNAKQVGIVTAVVGVRRFHIAFTGQVAHAGTTPVLMRRDAGEALIKFAYHLIEKFRDIAGEHLIWNLGIIALKPGAWYLVPGEGELSVEVRDIDGRTLDAAEAAIHECVNEAAREGNVECRAVKKRQVEPASMDPRMIRIFTEAAKDHGASFMCLPSGAMHDAMVMSQHVPTGMLFVPSIGGRSHVPEENTSTADIILGARVLLRAVELLRESS